MTRNTHSYSFTYSYMKGDIVMGEAEVQVKYTYKPSVPARIRYDENDYPAEDPEIEIVDVVVEDWPGPVWRTATSSEFEVYSEYALDKRFDDLVKTAAQDEEAARDDAAELAAGTRADLKRIFGE